MTIQHAGDEPKAASSSSMGDRPRGPIILSANTSWYLQNFRSGLIRTLQARGWHVVALSPNDGFSDRLEALGCEWLPLAVGQRSLAPIENGRALATYVQNYKRLRPAVAVHFTVKPVIFGSLAARVVGIPVVNTVTGLGNTFLRRDLVTMAISALYKPALRKARRVFFQNMDDLGTFLERGLLDERQVEMVAGSGVNLERFAPTEPPRNQRFTFLFVARLLTEKGLIEFVDAARIIRQSHPDLRFVLLGPRAAEADGGVSEATLQSWVREGVVEHLGATDDVRPHIAAADCVVLPSYREGTPRVLLEAGAMSRPSVATDVPGCREVVVDGETGLLCKPRDADDLAAALLRMSALSATARRRMGQRARARIQNVFDEQEVVARYVRAIEEAAEVSGNRGAQAPHKAFRYRGSYAQARLGPVKK